MDWFNYLNFPLFSAVLMGSVLPTKRYNKSNKKTRKNVYPEGSDTSFPQEL